MKQNEAKKKCSICGGKIDLPWDVMCYTCRKGYHDRGLSYHIRHGDVDETSYEDDIFCPWCGEIQAIDCECELYDEGDHEVYCDECEKPFIVSTSVSYSFSTERKQEDSDG